MRTAICFWQQTWLATSRQQQACWRDQAALHVLPCTCHASDSSQTFNRLLHVGPLSRRQTVFVTGIEAMLLNRMAVPYLPDDHKVIPYLPDSHKVIPYLPDNELFQVGLQTIRLVQYGGTSVSLHLEGTHLGGILPHHWVVPLQVIMLSLQHRTHCLAAVTRHAQVQITASCNGL